MSGFTLTANINIQKPGNLDQVSKLIQQKVGNINSTINVSIGSKSKKDLDQLNNSMRGLTSSAKVTQSSLNKFSKDSKGLSSDLKRVKKDTDNASSSMFSFGRQTAITVRRFGAYTLATAGFFKFVTAVKSGIVESIKFQDELIKIRQVTGESLFALKNLTDEIDRLSTSFGVTSFELLSASRVLAQAGLNAKEVRIALEALAKTDLAPTFDNINKTTEASIALMRQFGIGVGQLEAKLSSINAVASKFAVESGDITSAIQRTGGAFAAAGGSIEELIALFTSVRATTRESADSIATGFRTIFTRIQRTRTQNALQTLGVDLREFGDEARKQGREGLFVGPYKAVQRLSEALNQLDSSDPRFAQIVEELGGFRQISKVIPLIQQFATAENALGVALRGTNSLTEDAEKRQESLIIQLKKVREEFQVLLRTISNNNVFKQFTDAAIFLTRNLITLAETLEKLSIPLALLFAVRGGSSGRQFVKGLTTQVSTNKVVPFASGGVVRGFGNKDSELIAAMPGEFVVRKDSVKKYGTEFLHNLNEGRIKKFAKGGIVGGAGPGLAAAGVAALSFTNFEKQNKEIILAVGIFVAQMFILNKVLLTSSKAHERLNNSLDKFTNSIKKKETGVKESKESLGLSKNQLEEVKNVEKSIVSEYKLKAEEIKRNFKIRQDTANFFKKSGLEVPKGVEKSRSATNIQLKNLQIERDKKIKNLDIESFKKELAKNEILLKQKEQELQSRKALEEKAKQQIKNIERFNIGVSAAASALVSFGTFVSKLAKEDLSKLRSGENINVDSARRKFVGGETATSTGVAAAGGLAVVQLLSNIVKINPLIGGIIVGLTAAGTAIYSYVNAQTEFEKQLRSIDIEQTADRLGDALKKLETNLDARTFSFDVNRSLDALISSLRVETDIDNRDSIRSSLDSSVSSLIDFVKKVKSQSKTIDEFSSAVSDSTLQFIASKTNKTLEEYRKSIFDSIRLQKEQNDSLRKVLNSQRQEELGIISQRALNVAANLASDNLNKFSTALIDTINRTEYYFGQGISDVFERISSGVSGQGDENRLFKFSSNFGEASELLAQKSIEAARAINILPSILLESRAQDPLGQGTGAFADRISDSLTKAGIGPQITNAIVDQINNIIGPEQRDQSIVERIAKDFIGVFDEISKGIVERNKDTFNSLESSTNAALKRFADGLDNVNKKLESIFNKRLDIIGNKEFFNNVLGGVFGRDNRTIIDNERRIEQERNLLFTGGKNQQQLFGDLDSSQQKQIQLRLQLSQTQEIEKRKELIKSLKEQEQVSDRAKRALEFLADVSKRTADLQRRLSDETNQRLGLRNIAADIAFATPQERARQGLIVEQGRRALAAENIEIIPPNLRKEVLSFFKSVGNIRLGGLGGLTGEEAIDKILKGQFKQLGLDPQGVVDPNKKEIELLDKIREEVSKANDIQAGLIEREENENKQFIIELDKSFTNFLTQLNKEISSIFQKETEIRSKLVAGDRDIAVGQLRTLGGISQISGTDPKIVITFLDQIKKTSDDLQRISNIERFLTSDISTKDIGSFFSEEDALENFSDLIDFIEKNNKDLASLLRERLNEGLFADTIEELSKTKKVIGAGPGGSFVVSKEDQSAKIVFDAIQKEIKNLEVERTRATKDQEKLQKEVGGEEVFSRILGDIDRLTKLRDSLPVGADPKDLQREITKLTQQLVILNQERNRQGMSSGGFVGSGRSNVDTIPAMLANGEYVIKSSSVAKYGKNFFDQINKGNLKGFNKGGIVNKPKSSSVNLNPMGIIQLNDFNIAISKFNSSALELSRALSSFPSTISMTANHRVEVVINGAQVLSQLEPTISKMVVASTNRELNRFIDQKFPEVGPLV